MPMHRSAYRSDVAASDAERTVATLATNLDEEDIAALAYELWQARGCPHGSPQEDWFQAVEQIESRDS